jgi:drug/metabolite transporter (DMT)-like permease
MTLVTLIWSSNTIVTKASLDAIGPDLLTLTRFTLIAALFHTPVLIMMLRQGARLRRGEWARIAYMGIIGQAGSSLTYTIGVSYTTATYAGLILMTGPMWTALLALIFTSERLTRAALVGMAIAFAAAGFLATDGKLEWPDTGVLIGSSLLFGAQALWGGYTLMGKTVLTRGQPLLILSATNVFAVLGLWPATYLMGTWSQLHELADLPAMVWVAIVYLAIFTGAVSQLLYLFGLRAMSASQASSFTYLMPLFTGIMAAIFLDETLTALTFVCGGAIVFGVWLVNRPSSHVRASRSKPVKMAVGATQRS